MGVLVFCLGRTGTGKSFSMRNFPQNKLAVVNVQGKILPFKGGAKIEQTSTDDSDKIVKAIKIYAKDYKSIVIDDYQYVMSNEFMRRATERGYDKFTEIARHAWDIANEVKDLPSDVIVYVMCHTDTDAEGVERLKTIGKLLDEKIYLEGMSTIVLKTVVSDGKYSFVTQNNGKDTVKSPADMFPSYAIDNDLWYVDQKIREYYGLGATLSEEDLAEIEEHVKKDISPSDVEGKKKRGRKRGNKEQSVEEAPSEEKEEAEESAEEQPKKRSRKRKSITEEKEAVEAENLESLAMNVPESEDGANGVPFEDTKEPELKEPPKRKRRSKTDTSALTATTTLYFKHGDEYVVINEGEVIPNPADGYEGITKEQYDAATTSPADDGEQEEQPKRRRRRKA